MAEDVVSAQSAQDGVSIMWKMDDNGVKIDTLALVDKNGIDTSITTGYNNAGKIIGVMLALKPVQNLPLMAVVAPRLLYQRFLI